MSEAQIPIEASMVMPGNFSTFSGKERMNRLLTEYSRSLLPTAIFCGSDAIASGCIESLAEHGVSVPGEVSVAGFDDTLAARMTSPRLATVRQPFREMGHRAVDLLLPLILDRPTQDAVMATAEPGLELFDVEVVVRESIGPPRPALPS
jgi:LacI family transcriptional regulator